MVRNIEVLIAQELARARAAGHLPPLVLPFAFRGMIPFDPGTGGWPRDLHMPKGMGLMRCWDNIGRPVNDSAPTLAEAMQR